MIYKYTNWSAETKSVWRYTGLTLTFGHFGSFNYDKRRVTTFWPVSSAHCSWSYGSRWCCYHGCCVDCLQCQHVVRQSVPSLISCRCRSV